jgi:hypothetical protein
METERKSDLLFMAFANSEQIQMLAKTLKNPHRWTNNELVAAARNGIFSEINKSLMRHRSLRCSANQRLTTRDKA